MFNNAFPDGSLALSFSKECVAIATESLKPGAAVVHRRLEVVDDYLVKLAQAVSCFSFNLVVLILCYSCVLRSQKYVLMLRSAAALLVHQT